MMRARMEKSNYENENFNDYLNPLEMKKTDINLDNQLLKFWEVEKVPERVILSPNELDLVEEQKKALSHDNGKYTVKIPWKQFPPQLENNYSAALNRLISIEKRFRKENDLFQKYTDLSRNHH